MCAGYLFRVMRHTVKNQWCRPHEEEVLKWAAPYPTVGKRDKHQQPERVNQCKTKSECLSLSFAIEKISTMLSEPLLLTKSFSKERSRAGSCSLKTQSEGSLRKAKAFVSSTSIMQPLLIGLSLGTFNPLNRVELRIALSLSAVTGNRSEAGIMLRYPHYQLGCVVGRTRYRTISNHDLMLRFLLPAFPSNRAS